MTAKILDLNHLIEKIREFRMAMKDVLLTLGIATLAMLMHSSVMVDSTILPHTGAEAELGMDKPKHVPRLVLLEAGQNIIFTVTFNLTREAGSYNTFIGSLRQRLANGTLYAGGVPLLVEEQRYRGQFFRLVLISGNSQITLLIRMGDLYFVAIQPSNGAWYEFQPEGNNPSLFTNTMLLNYPSNYPRDGSLSRTVVGRYQLATVIETLANNPFSSRQYYMTLMVMFPEAIRFRAISDFVYTQIHDLNTYSPIDTYRANIINSWGDLSAEVRRNDLFASFTELQDIGVTYSAQAAALLGLVLFSNRGPTRSTFSTRQLSTTALSDTTTKGRQLVEIFWVKILNIDNENPGDLYGKIQIVDALTTPQYIFSRTKGNPLSIRPNEFVPLTGPTRAISAYDSFNIDFSLMDYDTLSPDDEVSNGQILWNYFANNVYDQPLSAEVKGQYGSVAISYAVYSDAVTATVQVTLINGDNENPANVYGTLTASNTLSNGAISLFSKKSNENVDVQPLQLIPLLRSVVVVPLSSSIKVVADLWDYDKSSSDDQIAQGSISFIAAESGSNTGRITGTYGVVEVKVTWSSNWA